MFSAIDSMVQHDLLSLVEKTTVEMGPWHNSSLIEKIHTTTGIILGCKIWWIQLTQTCSTREVHNVMNKGSEHWETRLEEPFQQNSSSLVQIILISVKCARMFKADSSCPPFIKCAFLTLHTFTWFMLCLETIIGFSTVSQISFADTQNYRPHRSHQLFANFTFHIVITHILTCIISWIPEKVFWWQELLLGHAHSCFLAFWNHFFTVGKLHSGTFVAYMVMMHS